MDYYIDFLVANKHNKLLLVYYNSRGGCSEQTFAPLVKVANFLTLVQMINWAIKMGVPGSGVSVKSVTESVLV